jgi:hypothetical protein
VASFAVPAAAVALNNGRVRVINAGTDEIPAVVLFESRKGALGYSVHRGLREEVTLSAPRLGADFAMLRRDLEKLLVEAGLFEREAAAMVETWRDSWFEEGTRLFYLVPPAATNAILPLTIEPRPERVERVFVGRIEVITGATEMAVTAAIASGNNEVLSRHARFLGPITDRILAKGADESLQRRIKTLNDTVFGAYNRRLSGCD